MKKIVIIEIIFLTFILGELIYLFLRYDVKGSEYGIKCRFCSQNLPHNIEIEFDKYETFWLLKDNFYLFCNNLPNWRKDLQVNNFDAYGYNDTSLVVISVDSLGNVRYLITNKRKLKHDSIIEFKEISDRAYIKIKKYYKWIELNKEEASEILSTKSILTDIIIIILVLVIMNIYKYLKL